MALVGISSFEEEEYVSRIDPSRVEYPQYEKDNKTPHPKAGQTDIQASKEAGATIFTVGALTVDQRAFITDKTGVIQEIDQDGTRLVHRNGSRTLEACRFGLRGWSNFKDPAGNDIPFLRVQRMVFGQSVDVPNNDSLARLGTALVNEIGEVILERNSFIQALAKNLNGLAPQSVSSQNGTAGVASPTSENSAAANGQ